MDYVLSSLELERVTITNAEEAVSANVVEMTCPGKPTIMFKEKEVSALIHLFNILRNSECILLYFLDKFEK